MKGKRRPVKRVSVTKQHLSTVLKSKNDHQKLITQFHNLNKRKQELTQRLTSNSIHQSNSNLSEWRSQLNQVEQDLDDLGGLVVYQKASILGEKRFNSASYLMSSQGESLKELRKLLGRPLRLLDVGALGDNYIKERSWLHTTAIDLHPTCTFVQQCDFFDLPLPNSTTDTQYKTGINIPANGYDVVALSLVVNFVGDAKLRGAMIKKVHQLLQPALPTTTTSTSPSDPSLGGYLYLVLPRPCLTNSRYLDEPTYLRLLTLCGFTLLSSKFSPKLAFHLFRRLPTSSALNQNASLPKRQLKDGPGLNNFTIVL